jgi:hypothetical protein
LSWARLTTDGEKWDVIALDRADVYDFRGGKYRVNGILMYDERGWKNKCEREKRTQARKDRMEKIAVIEECSGINLMPVLDRVKNKELDILLQEVWDYVV